MIILDKLQKKIDNLKIDLDTSLLTIFWRYKSSMGARYHQYFDLDTLQKLEKLATTSKSTLFAIVMACFKIVISIKTKQKNIFVSVPTTSRNSKVLSGITGFLTESVLCNTNIKIEESFVNFLSRVNETIIGAIKYGFYSPQKILNRHNYSINSNIPLGLNFQNLTYTDMPDADEKLLGSHEGHYNAIWDINCDIMQFRNVLGIQFMYKKDLFKPTEVENIFNLFKKVVLNIITKPNINMSVFFENEFSNIE